MIGGSMICAYDTEGGVVGGGGGVRGKPLLY